MSRKYRTVLANLACGVVVLSMSMPAAAIDLGGVSIGGNDRGGVSASVGGVSASVGTSNGVSADVNAGLGSTSANVGASVGGGSVAGINADANVGGAVGARSNTTVGGGGGSLFGSNTTASIGGDSGLNAGVNANVGNGGLGTRLRLRLGADDSPGAGGPGVGGPGNGGGGIGGGGSLGHRAISGMSDQQIAIYRKRCVNILRNPNAWEYDLVQLCKLLRQAAAR